MYLPKKFKYLEENQIAGAETINPIVDFLRGIRSLSSIVELNPNNGGSLNIDLNMRALRDWLERAYPHPVSSPHSFKLTYSVSGATTKVSCTGGKVFFPSDVASVSGFSSTTAQDESWIYIRMTSKTSGSLIYDNAITHTLQTGDNNFRVTLPIARTYKDGDDWKILYYHCGDFIFIDEPYFYIDGYDKSKPQALLHLANENGVRWLDYGDCSSSI